MKHILIVGLTIFLVCATLTLSQRIVGPEEASREAATKLFQSLNAQQKKLAAKDGNDKDRAVIRFATEGTGIPISQLSMEQRKLVDDLFRSMLSDYGLQRCLEMGGKGRITFYGTPDDDRFACRIDKNNHLTLVYTEFGKEPGGDFGPIALGAKGAGEATVWVEEDKLALELAAALTSDDAKNIKKGMPIGELSEKSRGHARKLLEQRLAVFSSVGRKVLDDAIRHDGGVDKLRIVLTGDASKSIDNGGRYYWTISGPAFNCAWISDGKSHPHMTLRAKRPQPK